VVRITEKWEELLHRLYWLSLLPQRLHKKWSFKVSKDRNVVEVLDYEFTASDIVDIEKVCGELLEDFAIIITVSEKRDFVSVRIESKELSEEVEE